MNGDQENPLNWASESAVAAVRRGIADPMGSAFKDPETLRLMLLSIVDVFIDDVGDLLRRVDDLEDQAGPLRREL